MAECRIRACGNSASSSTQREKKRIGFGNPIFLDSLVFQSVSLFGCAGDVDGVSLVATTSGEYVIREVSWTMRSGRPPYLPDANEINELIAGRVPSGIRSGNIGDLTPRVSRPVLILHPPKDVISFYHFNIIAFNGTSGEDLQVRFDQTNMVWLSQYEIKRGNRLLASCNWEGRCVKR